MLNYLSIVWRKDCTASPQSAAAAAESGKSHGNLGKSEATASDKRSAGALSKFPGTNINDDSCGSSIRDILIPSPIFTQSAESTVDLLNGDAVVYTEFTVSRWTVARSLGTMLVSCVRNKVVLPFSILYSQISLVVERPIDIVDRILKLA